MWTVREQRRQAVTLVLALGLVLAAGCGDDDGEQPAPTSGFSAAVLPILARSCATSGCHAAGTSAAAGLELDSYAHVIAGSDSGEAVIPYQADRSLAIELLEGRAASTGVDHRASARAVGTADLAVLRDWIADGCPDDNGTAAFSNLTNKLYVTGQGTDLISVISVDDLVVTRLIPVEPFPGGGGLGAAPHFGEVSADNSFWIVTMLNGPGLWKFDRRDSVLAKLETTRGAVSLAVMTPNAKKAYVTHYVDPEMPSPGYVSVIDLETFTLRPEIRVLNTSHGIAIKADGSEVYVGNFNSDHITVIDTSADTVVTHIPVSETVRGNIDSIEYRIVQLAAHPTRPLIYVSCSAMNEIRVIDRERETVVDSLAVPAGSAAPWHLKVTRDGTKLYTTNRGQEMMGGGGLRPGSVSVYSTEPFQLIANITAPCLWLAHGIEFDASERYCFVTSENANGGYTARHPVAGEDPPGTVAVIDMATNRLIKVLEVQPFATGVFATR